MINLIGILSMLIVLAILIFSVVVYFMYKANISDEDILGRDMELGRRTELLKIKNKIIKEQTTKIKELEDENKQLKKELKRANSKRLRQNS